MKTFVLLILAAMLTIAGMAMAASPAAEKAGKYSVELTSQPQALAVGENQLVLHIKDGDKPLTGAEVNIHLDMVGMSMPADVKAIAGNKAGEYLAKANLSMEGQWTATVKVNQMSGMTMAGDGEATFHFTVGGNQVGSASQAPASMPASPTPAQSDTNFLLIGIISGMVIVVGSIILAIRLRRSKV